MRTSFLLLLVINFVEYSNCIAQSIRSQDDSSILFPDAEWRNIGPNRGGRSIAVAGHKDRPYEYYFGATGGGLWKTSDGGNNWKPVTEGKIKSSSVGSVAVAESNPDIVYIGMGETQLRQNVLQGNGVYKSTDGGKNWSHLGLAETQAISRVRIHPTDPDVVYVAALGHPFGSNPERGIFKTSDGGKTWQKILYRNERTGAIDLVIDPGNPKILYASFWEVYRKPWILSSGGPGSGIFKSTDGGTSWNEITRNPGLPEGTLGKITLTVSGADSKRVYANIEAENGGLYRSDDGGATWNLINNHRDLWQRAFYFLRVVADPIDKETVYVLSFRLLKSTDGGKTFDRLPESHADHHDLWINPQNNSLMIEGNDGGGVVSVNGGNTWTHMRYPTAQIYRLAVTNDYPYHVCGAQQDNTTVCVASDGGFLRNPRSQRGQWMYSVGGGESGYIAPHPVKTNIFYAGATNTLTRYDRNTGLSIDIQPYPRIVMGEPAQGMPERWNWTYPIAVSPADPNMIFVGSQHLWRSIDEGDSWKRISPDLTRAENETLGDSGGPIVKDQDGPEIYATLYAIAPSQQDANIIWTGSDDGLIHLTRNGGKTWDNITPSDVPENTRIGLIEASHHSSSKAYVAGRRYEMDDRAPYIWKTDDYGLTWSKITSGIIDGHFVYAICEDPVTPELLFAGTEHGVYISLDDGSYWHNLSLNLPSVPVTGIVVKDSDLIISTHGRSFWVLNNIEVLRQINQEVNHSDFLLFKPGNAIRRSRFAVIDFYLKEDNNQVKIEIIDSKSQIVRTLFEDDLEKGMHRFTWNLRYTGAAVFPNIVLEGGNPTRGPWAAPGEYLAKLTIDNIVQTQKFEIEMDPRLSGVTNEDLIAQFNLASKIRDSEDAANKGVILIRNLKAQVNIRVIQNTGRELSETARIFNEKISNIEKELYQVKNQSPKDKIAFPIKLNDRLTGLRSHLERGDGPPTEAYNQVYSELSAELNRHLDALDIILNEDLKQLNNLLKKLNLEEITAKE
ncbi:MAG: glycosyl hydrolase [Bacteroidetes bacterium]|nr:glycosyl hydrolase [Bacteroidota bacterium]